MPLSRAVQRRRRPVASFSRLSRRTRIGGRVGMPTSRYLRSFRYGGFAANRRTLFGRGVAGSSRNVYARVGREVPLYVPPSTGSDLTEAHVLTTASGAMTFDATGGIVLLNSISQGDGLANRHGNRIQMLQLQLRGNANVVGGSILPQGFWAVVYDRQPTGALPALTLIYDAVNVNAFQALTTRDRFQILYRQDFQLEGANPAVTADSLRRFDRVVHLRKMSAYTVGTTTGTIADISTGALYLIWGGIDQGGGTAGVGTLNCRLVFTP